ncbi:MAG: aminotransferase class I/II-fold pyridoxal phosphate-dependent enzyme [bacterium]|nr:aminotransferase class I/II-fold pyridoxal phosphate-dependent enzyme [bacterium]
MKFTIGFEKEDTKKLHQMWDEVIASHRWSEGKFTEMFEEKWSVHNGISSVAFSSWAGAALAALEFFNVKGKTVLCPSNTFMATPLSVIRAGGKVEFVDCNREDFCISLEDLKRKIDKFQPVAVFVVHIGGHIAFQIKEIAAICKEKGIVLLEDCAHAHGSSWNGQKPGTWGDAGVYSFYATKTISTGEGGMLVSKNPQLIEFAKQFRNYGKLDYKVEGFNYRLNEFTAAIGCVQVDRLDDIIQWKHEYVETHLDPHFQNRIRFPKGMTSGYYKYIVFDEIENSTGKVYDQPCHTIMARQDVLPNTEWLVKNHWCVPLYYKGHEI